MDKWEKISETYCHIKPGEDAVGPKTSQAKAREQFSYEGLMAYDDAYRMSPLELVEDPLDVGRSILLHPDGKYAPPLGSSDWDRLLHWRANVCNSAEFKSEWSNLKKTLDEKYGKRMKPGYDEESKIVELYADKVELYADKMAKMKAVLQGEQERRGIKDPEWAELWDEDSDEDDKD
ncbi:hypothetical protein DMB37_30390 [Nocardia sp. CS682]|nr:hypothetical protein DMB37_30390 [Nocardia sp. CS682]